MTGLGKEVQLWRRTIPTCRREFDVGSQSLNVSQHFLLKKICSSVRSALVRTCSYSTVQFFSARNNVIYPDNVALAAIPSRKVCETIPNVLY